MKEQETKAIFLADALRSEKEMTKTHRFYKKHLINHYWGFLVEYFLRFIDDVPYENVVKLDLWDETVAMFTKIRENILKHLKPKRLYYIEFVKEFCDRFKRLYKTKNEKVINDNILNWPFEKNALDAIIDVSTSDHLDSRGFDKLIGEYHRSLRKGGYVIMLHLNKEYFNIKDFLKEEADFPTFPRDEKTIDAILRKKGFKIVSKKFLFPFLLDSSSRSSSIYSKMLLLSHQIFGNITFYMINEIITSKSQNIMIGYLIKRVE